MDILKKMFLKEQNQDQEEKSEFRKPSWFDEDETDDELFDESKKLKAFHMFTNPLELQKHFEHQMVEILKSLKQFEDRDILEKDFKNEYLKPGFEKNMYSEMKNEIFDSDLDGEIYADQLHSLMQRISPEQKKLITKKDYKPRQQKKGLSDEEIIMAKIHGSYPEEEVAPPIRRRKDILPKIPHNNFGGVFEGTYQGPRMFGQSVVSQTIRKPDGTYETKKVVKDSDGNVKTTISRTKEGKTEVITSYGNDTKPSASIPKESESNLQSDLNIYISKQGYALPKNLW